jgi:hypothetical protein
LGKLAKGNNIKTNLKTEIMQVKTIEKTIQKKLNEWIDSITDETLRKSIKTNCLLSGGSITSMLTNTDINDYDIYIKDMSVLLYLVKYYTQGIDGIDILDGRQKSVYLQTIAEHYDKDVEDVMSARAVALRTLHEDQIKLYFRVNKGGVKANEDKKPEDLHYQPVFFSPNAISLSDQIQIVIRFHGDDIAIHKTFDFIHATNYFTFATGLVVNTDALLSILTKQLRYQGSFYPLTSIIRMKKFIKRGWNINAGEILKIMFQISELDLKNPDVLEEQLIGVDVAYFGVLIEILRGVPTEKMTSGYLNTIIDKVFNSTIEEE